MTKSSSAAEHSITGRSRAGLLVLLALLAAAWLLVVPAIYYRQVGALLQGSGWGSLEGYVRPVLPLLVGLLLLLGIAAAVALVVGRRLLRPRMRRSTTGVFLFLVALGGLAFAALTAASTYRNIDPSLPYLSEALGRALVGLGGAALLSAAAVALGLGISRVLGWTYDTWREGLPAAASLGIGTFANLGLLLASLGLYRPPILQVLVAVVLIGAALAAFVRLRRQGLPAASLRPPRGANVLWIACTALALACAAVAALAPESQYDALWYHLAYPHRYLAAGYLVDLPYDYVSLFPMTVELWFGYGLAVGGMPAAVLLHYALLPLTAVLTWQLARRYVPGASPWLAVALLVTIPTVVWEASTAYIDLAMMLFLTLTLYGLLRFVDTERRQWLLLAALNLGFALASKHLALLTVPLFAGGLLLALWRRGVAWRQILPAVVLFVAVGLVFALPWYLRSFLASGNPVFPVLYKFLGAPPERWNEATENGARRFLDRFGRPRTLANLITLPWDMTMHAANYGGAFGPLFLLMLPLLALRRMRGALPWLLAFALLYTLLWASPVSSFQLRHLLPIAPVLAVLAAAAFSRLAALARAVGLRRAPPVLAACLAILMVVNLPPFTFLHEGDRVNRAGWLTSVLYVLPVGVVIGGESEDAYLARQVRSYPVWQFANAHLPPDARVLSWSDGEHIYTHADRIWANAAVAIGTAYAPVGQEAATLADLARLGITHLIVDRRPDDSPDPWDAYAVTGPTARAQWYDELYADDWYVLYRVRWEALD